ncbi:translation initiation factor IF-3 [Geosmithia morbida]|uniref:Translation initiation factor IF-3 n=1 Tax=Geosmithia morbida TaxID=1094350 RepID=A0A9P4YPA8_9HYPO|nr:translation initiation factor IF-3 [Geosmithia morbida]KAF4120636.1 translation initiation factor IF-3 [Geosmithia morbida]
MRSLAAGARCAPRRLLFQKTTTGPLPLWTRQSYGLVNLTASTTLLWRSFNQSGAGLARRQVDVLEERQKALEEEEKIDRRYTLSDYMDKTGRDRLPRDHEITDPKIMVLDGGSVEGPLATRFVLTKLNDGESLRMVQPYVPAKGDAPVRYALCKIVDSEEAYRADKERKERKKKTAKPKNKEVELSWSISEHDLLTKMRQVSGFLAKGYKVELVVGKKKGSRTVSEKDGQALVTKVKKEVEAAEGFEAKPAQGAVGATLRLYFEGKKSTAQ